jgi:hypothetical protein
VAGSIVWFRLLFSSPTHSSRASYLHERRARHAGLEAIEPPSSNESLTARAVAVTSV